MLSQHALLASACKVNVVKIQASIKDRFASSEFGHVIPLKTQELETKCGRWRWPASFNVITGATTRLDNEARKKRLKT